LTAKVDIPDDDKYGRGGPATNGLLEASRIVKFATLMERLGRKKGKTKGPFEEKRHENFED
jgi:hypothetical protein